MILFLHPRKLFFGDISDYEEVILIADAAISKDNTEIPEIASSNYFVIFLAMTEKTIRVGAIAFSRS